MSMVAILDSVPMVYCARCVNVVLPKCLMLNLVMSNLVVNSDLDFECAIYCWHNGGIYGMESLGFGQHSAELANFGFDWQDVMLAVVVSLYCVDDDSVTVSNWSMPLVVCYTVEQYPNHLSAAAISINLKHCRLLIPEFRQDIEISVNSRLIQFESFEEEEEKKKNLPRMNLLNWHCCQLHPNYSIQLLHSFAGVLVSQMV